VQDKGSVSIQALTGIQLLRQIKIKSAIINNENIKLRLNNRELQAEEINFTNDQLIISFANYITIPAGQKLEIILHD
jgi:hypothetical protein